MSDTLPSASGPTPSLSDYENAVSDVYAQDGSSSYVATGGLVQVNDSTGAELISPAKDLSDGLFASVYKNASGNIIVAFEGTWPLPISYLVGSLGADAVLASQLNTPGQPGQIPQALTDAYYFVADTVLPYANEEKIPTSNIFVTGHSLGASEAEYVDERFSALGLGGGDGFAGTGVPTYTGTASVAPNFVNYLAYGDPVANDASDSAVGQAIGIVQQNHVGNIEWLGDPSDQQIFIDDHNTIVSLTKQAATDTDLKFFADEIALAGADAKEALDIVSGAVSFHRFASYEDLLDGVAASQSGSGVSGISELFPQLQNVTTTTDAGGNDTQQGSYDTQTSTGKATTTIAETTYLDGAYEFNTTIVLGAALASDQVDYDSFGNLTSNKLTVNGRVVALQVGENASLAVSPDGQIVARVDSASGAGLLNVVADPSGSSASVVSLTDGGSQVTAVVDDNGAAETTLTYDESTEQAKLSIDGGIVDPVAGAIPYIEETADGTFVTELPDAINGSAALIEQKSDGSVSLVDTGAGGADGESLLEFSASYFSGDEVDLSDLSLSTMVTAEVGAGKTLEIIADQEGSGVVDQVDFKGNSGVLKLDAPAAFAGTIIGFNAGDMIDLLKVGTADGAELAIGNVLGLQGVKGVSLTLDPKQDFSNESFLLAPDGAGGTDITAESDGKAVAFAGADETLVIPNPEKFTGQISNLASGDAIDLVGDGNITDTDGTVSVNASSLPTLEVAAGAGTATLDLSQDVQDENVNNAPSSDSQQVVFQSSSGKLSVSGFDTFYLGSGKNVIFDDNVGQKFYLGSGTAAIGSLGEGSVVNAGSGTAVVNVSNDILFVGAKPTDQVSMFQSYALTGGLDWAGSESPWAVGLDGTEYGINTDGDLVIKNILGEEMYVANYVGGPDVPYADDTAGIYVASIKISAYNLLDNPAGSNWQQTQFEFVNALSKAYDGFAIYQGVDPLVLDLSGNGLALTDTSSAAPLFDMNDNGFAVRTGWVEPDDGFLVLDKNGNGKIDDASEMFGDSATGGFASLAAYDSNGDGVINAEDPIFSQLEIWRDLNGNGVTDPGELETLAQAGITSINLNAVAPATKDIVAGNQILSQSTFTYADGTTGAVADVSFHTDDFNTVYAGDTSVTAAAAALPDVKGFGTLSDLKVAMSHDSALTGAGPTLQSVVQNTLPTLTALDLPTLREEITPILTAWAKAVELPGADGVLAPVTPTGHTDVPLLLTTTDDGTTVTDFRYEISDGAGSYWKRASGAAVTDAAGDVIARPTLDQVLAETPADGQWTVISGAQLDFFDRYTGDALPLGGIPADPAAALAAIGPVIDQIDTTLNQITVALAMAGPLAPYFAGIAYEATDNTFTATGVAQLEPMYQAIFAAAPSTASGAAAWLAAWKPIIDVVLTDFKRPDGEEDTYGYRFASLVAAYETSNLPLDIVTVATSLGIPASELVVGGSTMNGTDGADIFYMSSGDQTAIGGKGPDNYVMGGHFGSDVIDDDEPSGGDQNTLRFATLKSTDIAASRDGLDLILTDAATGQTVRVQNEFIGIRPSLFGGNLNDAWGVSQVTFADGVVWNMPDIAWAVAPNTNGTDGSLIGTPANDVLDGGRGNHFMSGGDGGDVYLYGLGDGADTIEDKATDLLVTAPDVVDFGTGIAPDDIGLSRDGNSDDLDISIKGDPADTLKIIGQFAVTFTGVFGNYAFDRIEGFHFQDGTDLSWQDIQDELLSQEEATPGAAIYGFDTDDTIDPGLGGGHFMSGGNGNDTYVFGLGYGDDTIQDETTNVLGGTGNTVLFNPDVDPGTVQVVRNSNSNDVELVLTDGSTLTLEDQLGRGEFDAIETVQFQDAAKTQWSYQDIVNKAIAYEVQNGGGFIYGSELDDIIDPGKTGNQFMSGGDGNDTYVFGMGYGHDTISDETSDILYGTGNTIRFNVDVDPSKVTFTRGSDPSDLVITLADGSELDVVDTFAQHGFDAIQDFQFQDAAATLLTAAQVEQKVLANEEALSGSTIYGFDSGAYGAGSGTTIDGKSGNDTLIGLDGDNTFVFGLGYGKEVIESQSDGNPLISNNFNTLSFGAGILPSMLVLSRSDDDVTVGIAGTSDSVLIKGQFAYDTLISQFDFADGTSWDLSTIEQNLIAQGSNIVDSKGLVHSETGLSYGSTTFIYNQGYGALEIDDYDASAAPDNILQFGAGIAPEQVTASYDGFGGIYLTDGIAGDQVQLHRMLDDYQHGVQQVRFADGTVWSKTQLIAMATTGSPNNTYLYDGLGDALFDSKGIAQVDDADFSTGNTFIYDSGYGVLQIKAGAGAVSPGNVIRLGAGIAPGQVSVSNDGNGGVDLTDGTAGDQIDVYRILEDSDRGVEQLQFADGTVWSQAQLILMATTGFAGNTYLYDGLGNGMFDSKGVARVDDAGSSTGNTFVYESGYGDLQIDDLNGSAAADNVLQFGIGIGASQVKLASDGNGNLVITDGVSGDAITIKEMLTGQGYGIQSLKFADGALLDIDSAGSGDILFSTKLLNQQGVVTGETEYDKDGSSKLSTYQAGSLTATTVSGVTGQPYTSYTTSYGSDGRPVSASYSDGETAGWSYNADGSYAVAYTRIGGQAGANETVDYGIDGAVTSTSVGVGADQLALKISEDAYQGDAQYTVAVDGQQIGGTLTAASAHGVASDTLLVNGNWGAGPHSVTVDFLNDLYGGSASADRNLYVDSAIYNGATVSGAEAALYGNGPSSLGFNETPSATPTTIGSGPDRLALDVSEDAYEGDAQYTVSVDGQQIGGPQTAFAAHGKASDTLLVNGDWGTGPHSVTVDFLNDLYGGSASADRNLYVDGATYDGVTVSGAQAALYANGLISLGFNETPSATPTSIGSGPDRLALDLSEDAYQGDAQYTVSVDGKQIGGPQTAFAAHGKASDTLLVNGSWASGDHTFTVAFLNDLYGGSPGADRNLYLDSAAYNGATVSGAQAALYGNGPQSFVFHQAAAAA